jgi:eukaryotic translation initiation factor 2C
MVRELLEAWVAQRKVENYSTNSVWELPRSIIYYRDGVGTGQYDKIKEVEVKAIREAYSKLAVESTNVNIHAVAVVKRHQTRFYPLKKRRRR